MITIVPNFNINKSAASYNKTKSFMGSDNSDLIEKGNQALNENKYEDALNYYQQANSKTTNNKSIYRKIAKAYSGLKDYVNAEKNYNLYLSYNPNDLEGLLELGEVQRQGGFYNKALETFEKAYSLDNTNDLAKRKILETKNNQLSITSPLQAKAEKQAYAAQNLKQALDLTVKYLGVDYMKGLSDVSILFGTTASMGGTPNIAQWENYKKTITVSDSYIYAAPQVIAAYLSHEAVHAHDKDAYTSVREEQDAYEVAAKFWIKYAKGAKDPEMDYAADLYKQSPNSLKARVKEIYELRDPSIAKTSPNHPPGILFNNKLTKRKAAAQGVKQYNIIA